MANLIRYGTFQLSGDFPDLVTNGDFATNDTTGWTESGEGGTNSIDASSGACAFVNNEAGFDPTINQILGVSGVNQNVKVDIVAVTGTGVQAHSGQDSQNFGSTGTFNFTLQSNTPPSGSALAFLIPITGDTGTVDNILCRTASPWIFDNDWDLFTDGRAEYISTSNDSNEALNQGFGSTEGSIYRVSYVIANFSGTNMFVRVGVGGGAIQRVYGNTSEVAYLVAGAVSAQGVQFRPQDDAIGDTFRLSEVFVEKVIIGASTDTIIVTSTATVDNGGINEGTGPNTLYNRLSTLHNGFNTWVSDKQMADGAGSTSLWYIWYDNTNWIISTVIGTNGDNYWTVTSTQTNPSNLTFTAAGNALGSAITFNGPVTGNIRRHHRRERYE